VIGKWGDAEKALMRNSECGMWSFKFEKIEKIIERFGDKETGRKGEGSRRRSPAKAIRFRFLLTFDDPILERSAPQIMP
jgi:hypothetical protein